MMSPTKKITLTVLIWVILTGAIFTLVMPRLSKGLISMQNNHQDQISQLADLKEQVQALKNIQGDLTKVNTLPIKPSDLFTSDLHLVNEIKEIEQYAEKTNLTETLTVSGTADKAQSVQSASGLSQVPYSIVLKGPFPNEVTFMKYLENSSFISPVVSFSVLYFQPNNATMTILTNFYIYR
ncbi:MAG: hypothetical protein JWO40_30 [Candidatus Doudnabacteria bacterium]|nr:hypothetical protein [Candidatus Doudnabacteria bacterium]